MERIVVSVTMRIYLGDESLNFTVETTEEYYYKPLFNLIYMHIVTFEKNVVSWDEYLLEADKILAFHGLSRT